MNYRIVFNPGSRSGKSVKKLGKIKKFFKDEEYDLEITSSLKDVYDFSRWTKEGETLIAVGGDGTINMAINGLMSIGLKNPLLGVIYTGTSPDFCKYYKIPYKNLDEALQVIKRGFQKPITLGLLSDGKRKWYFAVCMNIGIGADIAQRANRGIRGFLGDRLGTFISLIRAFLNYRQDERVVITDGEKITYNRLTNISVGRSPYIASGIKVNRDETFMGSGFYFLAIDSIGIKNLFPLLKGLYSGELSGVDGADFKFVKRVEVSGPLPFEADGDPIDFNKGIIESREDSLSLLVSYE